MQTKQFITIDWHTESFTKGRRKGWSMCEYFTNSGIKAHIFFNSTSYGYIKDNYNISSHLTCLFYEVRVFLHQFKTNFILLFNIETQFFSKIRPSIFNRIFKWYYIPVRNIINFPISYFCKLQNNQLNITAWFIFTFKISYNNFNFYQSITWLHKTFHIFNLTS